MNRSEFSDFLFASLGEEENGMTLSVVSALARLGFDPWREAARLADLPRPQAVAALAGSFDQLPHGLDGQFDHVGQATRLISLLPAVQLGVAAAPTGSRRWRSPDWRLPRLGFSGICLVLVLVAVALTCTHQALFTTDAPPPAGIATRP